MEQDTETLLIFLLNAILLIALGYTTSTYYGGSWWGFFLVLDLWLFWFVLFFLAFTGKSKYKKEDKNKWQS